MVANIGEKPSQNFLVYPRTCLIYPYLIFCWVRDNMFNCRFFHQQAIDFWWTFTTWGRGIEIQWIFGFLGINGLIAISIRSRKQSNLEGCMGLFWCLISFTSSIESIIMYRRWLAQEKLDIHQLDNHTRVPQVPNDRYMPCWTSNKFDPIYAHTILLTISSFNII